MRRGQFIGSGLILTVIVLVSIGLWRTAGERADGWIAVVGQPKGVMGTTCALAAVVPYRERTHAEEALRRAEAALRMVEARMSVWLADSEISRLNAARSGEETPLSPGSLEVLRAAREAAIETGGAFDVTCRPLVELWRRAGEQGVVPAESERNDARAASNWELLELTDRGVVKRADRVCVDLGGIAKGLGIDRAVEVLRRAGVAGGMVVVGGDLACFGEQADGRDWPVDVKNPFGPGRLAQLRVRGGAVATSGDYARYVEIAGKRYGHIIDPRVGRPTEAAQAVTVVAPTALTADIWATALSVLGPEGFRRLPEHVDALMIVGSKDDHEILCTAGFRALLEEPIPAGLTVWEEGAGGRGTGRSMDFSVSEGDGL
ncbi:MAG TPA: FAD:protein FMN transferase [Thermoguttaceae bacterium]|nr:FAD:protein FMN transferase [Thermoguttaceae bacterium]